MKDVYNFALVQTVFMIVSLILVSGLSLVSLIFNSKKAHTSFMDSSQSTFFLMNFTFFIVRIVVVFIDGLIK